MDSTTVSGSVAAYLLSVRLLATAFIIVGAGSLMARWEGGGQQRTLERLNNYVFIPCLVFAALNRTPLTLSEALIMAAGALLLTLAATLPVWLGPSSGTDNRIPLLFGCTGTLLLPFSFLLFGSQGLAKATFFHLTAQLLLHTCGMRCSGRPSQLAAFLKTPALHAMLLALLLKLIELDLPQQLKELLWLVEKGIGMMALGALPVLLMSHGYALYGLRTEGAPLWSPSALFRTLWLPLTALAAVVALRSTGIAPLDKGYDLLRYLDLRTTEAILLLAATLPCALPPSAPPGGTLNTSPALASSLYALAAITLVIIMINRYLFT